MEGGGKEQNYWPGFVDALSNVVLTLVFVLVIFVFALVMASSKIADHVEKRVRSEIETSESSVKEGKGEIYIESDTLDQRKEGAVGIANSDQGVVLDYPQGITEMDAKSAESLDQNLLKLKKRAAGAHTIQMRSFVGKESYSAARRFAYYRAMSVRNRLIKLGEAPVKIKISIVNPSKPEDGRVEIIFKK
jgi:hypothetical protein